MPAALIKGSHLIGLIEGTYSLCVHNWNEGWHKILPRCFIIKGKFMPTTLMMSNNYFDDE